MYKFLTRLTFLPNNLSAFLLTDLYFLDFLLNGLGLPSPLGLLRSQTGFFGLGIISSFFSS
jgi:hypothetical protein